MKNTHLKTYYEQFSDKEELLTDLKAIAKAYGGNVIDNVILPVTSPVAVAYFTSLGFQYVKGLLIRDFGDEGWSAFTVTELSSGELVRIEGVSQGPGLVDISEISGARQPIVINSAAILADIVLSGRNLPAPWKRLLIDQSVLRTKVVSMATSLNESGMLDTFSNHHFNDRFSYISFGSMDKKWVIVATDLDTGITDEYNIHFFTPLEFSDFQEQLDQFNTYLKDDNEQQSTTTAAGDMFENIGAAPNVQRIGPSSV